MCGSPMGGAMGFYFGLQSTIHVLVHSVPTVQYGLLGLEHVKQQRPALAEGWTEGTTKQTGLLGDQQRTVRTSIVCLLRYGNVR
jgi:hypothetical protein